MYVVTRDETEVHQMVGLFSSLDKAKREAEIMSKGDTTNDYNYRIHWFYINVSYSDGQVNNEDRMLWRLDREEMRKYNSRTRESELISSDMVWEEMAKLQEINDPIDQFVYDLLNEVPPVVDAYQDIINAKGVGR